MHLIEIEQQRECAPGVMVRLQSLEWSEQVNSQVRKWKDGLKETAAPTTTSSEDGKQSQSEKMCRTALTLTNKILEDQKGKQQVLKEYHANRSVNSQRVNFFYKINNHFPQFLFKHTNKNLCESIIRYFWIKVHYELIKVEGMNVHMHEHVYEEIN